MRADARRKSQRRTASLASSVLLAASWAALGQDTPNTGATSQGPAEISPVPYENAIELAPLAPPPALVAAESGTPDSGLEKILVTARRTAENLQDVPVAISALSADDLVREEIGTPNDLNGRVPSLVISSGSQMRNTQSPTIRGQGAQFGSSPGVIIYLGEVALPSDPVANYQGGAGKVFDLSNLQLLKGSQGTLFGRNTTGGALLLEPRKPEDHFSASLGAGASTLSGRGNLTGQTYEAVINTPITADTLRARFGAQFFERDGFTKDVVTGKDYDSKLYWTARAGLLWRPAEDVENYLMSYWSDSDDNGTATVIDRINREGLNRAIPGAIGLGALGTLIPGFDPTQVANAGCLALNAFGPSTNCGQDILDEQQARGKRRVQLSGDPRDSLTTGAIVDKFSYALAEDLDLVNIASYSTLKHSYRWDLDGSRAAFNEFINPANIDQADVRTLADYQLFGVVFVLMTRVMPLPKPWWDHARIAQWFADDHHGLLWGGRHHLPGDRSHGVLQRAHRLFHAAHVGEPGLRL